MISDEMPLLCSVSTGLTADRSLSSSSTNNNDHKTFDVERKHVGPLGSVQFCQTNLCVSFTSVVVNCR